MPALSALCLGAIAVPRCQPFLLICAHPLGLQLLEKLGLGDRMLKLLPFPVLGPKSTLSYGKSQKLRGCILREPELAQNSVST